MAKINPNTISEYKKSYSTTKLKKYLKQCEDQLVRFVASENGVKGSSKGKKNADGVTYVTYKNTVKVNLPSVEGYAIFLKYSSKTLFRWAKAVPEFRVALDKILERQKKVLIEKGLEGVYNPTIAKLLLSSNHGMRESSDVTSGGEVITSFSDEQISRIAQRLARAKNGDDNTSS